MTYITGAVDTREKAVELETGTEELLIEDIFKMAMFDSEVEMQYLV